jgi:hypothetical protein
VLERFLVVGRSLFPQRIPQIIVRLCEPWILFYGLLKFCLCFWEFLCQHQFNALIVDRDRGITNLLYQLLCAPAPSAGRAASAITATVVGQEFCEFTDRGSIPGVRGRVDDAIRKGEAWGNAIFLDILGVRWNTWR